MHCDDSGGLCAAEQGVNRWGGERGWYSAERGRSAGREASEHRAVPSSSSQAARRLLPTGSDYSLPAGDDRNGAVQHSTLCAAHPSASGAPGDICVAGDMQHTHRDQVGYGLVFTRRIKGGTPRQTHTHLLQAPKPHRSHPLRQIILKITFITHWWKVKVLSLHRSLLITKNGDFYFIFHFKLNVTKYLFIKY